MPNSDTALAAIMYAPNSVIPAHLKKVAAILYGAGDDIPDHLLKLALSNRGGVLATGQTTQYSSELDDGYYEKGIARRYEVLTAGQYSGTVNIDLAHYTATAGQIAFDNVAKTITDVGNGLAIFKTNDVIITSATNNPGPFTVTTGNVAGTITCTGATFVTETPAGAITISKREAHNNACVLDLNTGLMWSRTVSGKMGAASNGKMPWTGVAYDIFQYAAVANTASLGGYTDWRIPNLIELLSIWVAENTNPGVDTTAFPSFPSGNEDVWSSTTIKGATANAFPVDFINHENFSFVRSGVAKTSAGYALLVRGG